MKQKLIDANKVLLTDKERKLCMFDAGMAFLQQEAKIIEALTVDAIPVDWIKKYVENNTQLMINPKYENTEFTDEEPFDYYIKLYPYQINTMLREWEKEDE